jgi:SH3 domain-containing protein
MGNRAPIRMLPSVLWLLIALTVHAQTSDQDEARNRPGDFVINRPASLYAKPSADAHIIRQLHPRTVVRVVEVLDQWYKIESTKGHENGFVRRSYADPYGARGGAAGQGRRFRVGTFRLSDPVVVREQPSTSSPKLATLRAGAEVRVVDKDPSGLWYKIESETGNRPPGWIPTQAAKRIEGR